MSSDEIGFPDDEPYTPSVEEMLERWPDANTRFNIEDPRVRQKLWNKPNSMNLQPKKKTDPGFKEWQAKGSKAGNDRKSEIAAERKLIKKERAFMLGLIRDEIKEARSTKIKPRDIIEMSIQLAMAKGTEVGIEMAAEMALKLLEYDEPKLARIESENTHTTVQGKASQEDMEQFAAGVISFEEYRKRQKGE